MPGSRYVEWLNGNSARAFPFVEGSSFACADGKSVPLSLVLDLRLVAFGFDPGDVRLVSAVSNGESCALGLSMDGMSASLTLFPGRRSSERFRLPESDAFLDAMAYCGVVPGAGTYTPLDPPSLIPSRVMVLRDGVGVDTLSCGEVVASGTIEVEDGINTTADIAGNSVRVRVRRGLGLQEPCPEIADGRGLLYYLNGQRPDPDGNIGVFAGPGTTARSGEYNGIPAVFVSTDATMDGFIYGD